MNISGAYLRLNRCVRTLKLTSSLGGFGCACVRGRASMRESRSGPWTASVSSTAMLIEVLCLQWRNASTWGCVCGKGRVVFLFFYLLLASRSVQVNTALGISITSLKIKQQRGQDLKFQKKKKTSRDFLSLQAIEAELSGTEMSRERRFHSGSQPTRAQF